MKHFFLFILMACLCQIASADSPTNGDHKELCSKTLDHSIGQCPAMRVPARTDLLLILEDSGITIRFNGDFGPGIYQFTDNATGTSICGSVVAEFGGTEYVPFDVTSTSSFDFYIEFEDGSWSRLTWGAEEE